MTRPRSKARGNAPPASTRDRGRAREREAARFLESKGLEILEHNAEAGDAEIDLVARLPGDGNGGEETIVFVEVRSRSHVRHGDPAETVDSRKRRQIVRAATAWLVAHDLWERVAVRFDVLAVVGDL